MRVCDNCYGRKDGVLTIGSMGISTIASPMVELCMPCVKELQAGNWMKLDDRMEKRVAPGIGHQE